MPDLTLEQVREAGCHAQRDIGGGRYWDYEPDFDYEELTLHLPLDEVCNSLAPYALPVDGWHHAKGCNCEFCEIRAQPITRHLTLPGCDCEFCRS